MTANEQAGREALAELTKGLDSNGTQPNATPTASAMFDVLWEGIQRIRNGETTPANMNAIVNGTAAMLRIVKLQMDYAKLTGKTPEIPMLLTASSDA